MADAATVTSLLESEGLHVSQTVELAGSNSSALVVSVPGTDALSTWKALRSMVPHTGHYPIVAGGPVDFGGGVKSELELTLNSASFYVEDNDQTVQAVLDEAESVDVPAWLDARQTYLELSSLDLEAPLPLPEYPHPKGEFTSVVDIVTGEPHPSVDILLLPTPRGWEAPAFLMWGGWNDVPQPHELVAILRHWSEAYDAELVAMTSDVVELTVASPPTDADGAVEIATEQFLVAPDIVWQGTGDLNLLAAGLLDSPTWFFWWD